MFPSQLRHDVGGDVCCECFIALVNEEAAFGQWLNRLEEIYRESRWSLVKHHVVAGADALEPCR